MAKAVLLSGLKLSFTMIWYLRMGVIIRCLKHRERVSLSKRDEVCSKGFFEVKIKRRILETIDERVKMGDHIAMSRLMRKVMLP